MIHFTCVACGHLLQIKDYFAGCKVQCPSCHAELTTPGEAETAPPTLTESRSLPRPPALPPLARQGDGEPMMAIPGLLEGASVANAIPVNIDATVDDMPSRSPHKPPALPSQMDRTAPLPKPPPWMETSSWHEESNGSRPQEVPRPARRSRHDAPQVETSRKALFALVLGMGTFVVPVVLAVPAVILAAFALLDVRRGRGRVEGRGLAYTAIVLAVVGNISLIPILLVKAHLGQSSNERKVKSNLERIARAMDDYHNTHRRFPPAYSRNAKGELTVSWRVHLLPHLGEGDLYREFRLDEPWDSQHNRKLLARMPAVFGSEPRYQADEPYSTHFQVFTGLDTIFRDGAGAAVHDIRDGSSMTFLVVEARTAVPWTKPEDMAYQRGRDLPALGSSSKEGFYASMADGSVRFVDHRVDKGMLHNAVDPNDGGIVHLERDRRPGPWDRPIFLPGDRPLDKRDVLRWDDKGPFPDPLRPPPDGPDRVKF